VKGKAKLRVFPISAVIFLSLLAAANFGACEYYGGKGRDVETAKAPDVLHIIGADQFQKEVLDHDGPVLVDFGAHWCAPCRMVSPHLNRLAQEMEGKLKVVSVYEDESEANGEIFARYKIRPIPAFKIFKSGKVVASEVGARSYDGLKRWVESNI
jgi:thioredoxin 1